MDSLSALFFLRAILYFQYVYLSPNNLFSARCEPKPNLNEKREPPITSNSHHTKPPVHCGQHNCTSFHGRDLSLWNLHFIENIKAKKPAKHLFFSLLLWKRIMCLLFSLSRCAFGANATGEKKNMKSLEKNNK